MRFYCIQICLQQVTTSLTSRVTQCHIETNVLVYAIWQKNEWLCGQVMCRKWRLCNVRLGNYEIYRAMSGSNYLYLYWPYRQFTEVVTQVPVTNIQLWHFIPFSYRLLWEENLIITVAWNRKWKKNTIYF